MLSRRDLLARAPLFAAVGLAPNLAYATGPPPVVMWARILNAQECAEARYGLAGALLGPLLDVETGALREAQRVIQARFDELGVEVELAITSVATTRETTWAGWSDRIDAGRATIMKVPAGTYKVLRIEVPDPVAAARTVNSMVGVGRALGVRVDARVFERVATEVLGGAHAQGADAIISLEPLT